MAHMACVQLNCIHRRRKSIQRETNNYITRRVNNAQSFTLYRD